MTCRFASLAQSYISHCKHLLSMAMIAHCDGAQLYCGALPCYLGAMMQSVTYVALDSCITQYLFVSLHFHLSVPRCNDRICFRRRSCSPTARHVSSCASPETTRRDRQQYGIMRSQLHLQYDMRMGRQSITGCTVCKPLVRAVYRQQCG